MSWQQILENILLFCNFWDFQWYHLFQSLGTLKISLNIEFIIIMAFEWPVLFVSNLWKVLKSSVICTFNVKEDKKTVTKFWQFKPFPDIFNACGFASKSKVFQFNLETGSNFPITEFETQFFKTLLRQTKPWARQLISFWHFPHKLQFDQVRGNVSMHVFEVSIYNDK